jgi:DNA-binding response OmpR family regulator
MQRTRTRSTILVVEDYADSRHMLRLLLETLDYGVLTAANGKEALALAANNPIDLILLDFGLPDMTGPAVLRHLRRLNNGMTHVPIVMLTAFEGREYRRLADEAGCDAYVVKPPDFETLRGIVERLLRESQTKKDKVAFRVQNHEDRSRPREISL